VVLLLLRWGLASRRRPGSRSRLGPRGCIQEHTNTRCQNSKTRILHVISNCRSGTAGESRSHAKRCPPAALLWRGMADFVNSEKSNG
jgi:hypothetical protein